MKKVLIVMMFVTCLVSVSFGGDWGGVDVDPQVHKLGSKSSGNTHTLIFDACLYIPISGNGTTYYYYIKENENKYLASLLMMKYSTGREFRLGWHGSTTTSNGKIFRRINQIQ